MHKSPVFHNLSTGVRPTVRHTVRPATYLYSYVHRARRWQGFKGGSMASRRRVPIPFFHGVYIYHSMNREIRQVKWAYEHMTIFLCSYIGAQEYVHMDISVYLYMDGDRDKLAVRLTPA